MAESWMFQPSNLSHSPKTSPESGGNLSALSDALSPDARSPGPRIRRRNRQITSCLECRRRKLKCDKQAPCTNCTRFKRDCLYLTSALDSQSQQKLANIKEKMGALEKDLEREVANNNDKTENGGTSITKSERRESDAYEEVNEEDDLAEDEEILEPTPLAALDNVYEDNGNDELIDLGVQMGKVRISERIGGWVRPKLVEELNDTLKDVSKEKSRWSSSPAMKDHLDLEPGASGHQKMEPSSKSYIGPGPDYIAPASSLFFPGTNMSTNLLDYLPSKQAADQLIAQYFFAVHYMCKVVHRPTFEAQYMLFWGQIATGIEPTPAVQAIIFAAMFSAVVSMDEQQVVQKFGATRASLVDSLRSGTEFALSRANFLRTTKVDTMQAFVMYLIPLIRAEVSRAHSALVGAAIRLAECIGLHRDGTQYAMSPIEVQVRRLIWYQLCFLDLRTGEATGPRPQIRRDDYDTQFPWNVNDADLLDPTNPPKEDKPYWTDATFSRLRAEYVDLRRALWFDVVQIDKKKKSLASTVIKIQKTKTAIESKYLPMMDHTVPFHMVGKHILTSGLHSCFVQVLHRYLFSVSIRMPDRLRQLLIGAGLTTMENSIMLETTPELAPWTWYKGAFNQYHAALLFMVDVYANPMRKDAPRIWKCLDYVFDIPPHLPPKQKAELVLADLRDRMEDYQQMRKSKATTHMEERISTLGTSYGSRAYARSIADQRTEGGFSALPPAHFSPPPPLLSDSGSIASPPADGAANGDVNMQNIEDIDWAEWDKYFPLEENSGDLNVSDFDFAQFTGSFSGPPMDLTTFDTSAAAPMSLPSIQDLADVNFTPALYPDPDMVAARLSNVRRQ